MVTCACSGWSGRTRARGTCSTSRSSSGCEVGGRGWRRSRVERRLAGPGVGVDDREVDLGLVGVEVEEQLVDLVDDLVDARVGTVDLVDHEDHRQPRLQRLAQHEPRLRQRALAGVDEQQHAVDHRQAALDLAAEVGVARRVDDVELHVAVAHRGVLGQDRDPLLALEVHRVEHPVGHVLVGAKRARLPQQGVDQRRLAVVDVGDDRDVADVGAGRHGAGVEVSLPPVRRHLTPPPRGRRARCWRSRARPTACADRGGRARRRAGSRIRHVFVIVLENESAAATFGPDSPAPYLSKTLPARGRVHAQLLRDRSRVAGQLHRHDQRPGAQPVDAGRLRRVRQLRRRGAAGLVRPAAGQRLRVPLRCARRSPAQLDARTA